MIETPSAALNQQGQLAPDQRDRISGWLIRQQLRAVPSLLPLVAVIVVGVLFSNRLADATASVQLGQTPVSLPVVPTFAAIVIAFPAVYALMALRRISSFGNARAALAAPHLQQSQGTVVRHGDEHVAVFADGRSWNLNSSRNVCPEMRRVVPDTYTFYSLALQVPQTLDRDAFGGDGAWLLSAQAHSASTGPTESTLLQTLAATNGFQVDALSDNRAGRLNPAQTDAVPLEIGPAPLLTAPDISRAIGEPVGEPTFRGIGPNGIWTYPAGDEAVTLAIIRSDVAGRLPIPFLAGRLRRGTPIPNFGDEAFFDNRHLVVRATGTYVAIDGIADVGAATTLARQALARLKS